MRLTGLFHNRVDRTKEWSQAKAACRARGGESANAPWLAVGNRNSRRSLGYGLKFSVADRDACSKRSWGQMLIALPDGNEARVNVAKASFWGLACRELISADMGRWLLAEALAPWPAGKPPKLELRPISEERFRLAR